MKKTILFFLTFSSVFAFSQQVSLNGKVVDSSENRNLENAVVSIIRPVDSILINFTRTKADGSFSINKLPVSTFILLITYPGYADYFEMIKDSSNPVINLHIIPLTKKSQLLEAVIVSRKISAIRMKGDTLEYRADSFAVRQGATVDELLKQLPGIQVDRNGVITAQGQKVNKVLVDGEEFFSDDPAVVIKNLQAEAVKEVQVFDKKSEQAEFTGIDDGERSKTINLTLKPEKKKGYFAKASANVGTKASYDNDIMLNSFKGTRKLAAFGILSNTGRQGLNWQENDKFGGGYDFEFNEEEGYFTVNDYDNEFNQGSNREDGLPVAWSAGLHFSDKWAADRNRVNINYRFLKKNLRTEDNTISQYILPDTQYFNTQTRKSFTSRTGHQVKGMYEIKFDSLSSMKISVSGNWTSNENASSLESLALNADSAMVNRNQRLITGVTDKTSFNANILYRKRFRRPGRTISLNFQQKILNESFDGFLDSETNYYNSSGDIYNQEQVDQKKRNTQNSYTTTSNIVYTEPLSKTVFASVNYGLNFMRNEALRNSFNKGAADSYDKLDSLFSNDFRFRYIIHSAGADIKYNKKKVLLVVGSGINFSRFKQTDLVRDSSRDYSYVNYFPKLMFKFSPRQYSGFTIRYNGRNNPPTLNQLQPIRENTDPLNIQLGNPALRQEFVHTMSVSFNDYQILSERGTYVHVYSNFMQNAISTSTIVDAGGKSTFQPINVKGNYTAGLYSGYNWKVKKPGIYIDLGAHINKNRMSNKLNNLDNVNDFSTYTIYSGVRKSKNEKYNFYVRPNIGYTFSRSSLRPDVTTKYFTSETEISAWTKLPWKLEFWSAAYVNIRQKTDVFDNNRNVIQWDANIVKKLLKNSNLEFKIAVFDILNQNLGFRRTVNSNIITENSFITLRRRWMLGIQYNISKNP